MENLVEVVDWSRWQFALTAMYHWLFVPLTLGISVIIGIMETIYYRTRSRRWLAITKFWMTLFGINFALGVATGIILEFEFGTNWSNYSWFVGDIFGSAARHRGAARILHGIDVYRSDVFRMEQGQSAFSSGRHGSPRSGVDLGSVDTHRQRLDAASGGHGV